MSVSTAASPRINRWWFVATGFLTLLFGTSTVNVLFNVVGKPMTADLGWSRTALSDGLSIETVFVGISIVVLGVLIDRYGPKAPSVALSLVFGIGLMAVAAVPDNKTVFFVLCAIIGAGAGAVNPIAHATVVSAWFSDRRGAALGCLMAGLGACGVLMPYLANALAGPLGWRGTFLVIGALCTVIPVGVYAFVTRMPDTHESERRRARASGAAAGESLPTIARRYRQFWQLSLAVFLVSSGTFGLMSQVVPMSTDKGVAQSVAVSVLSVLSLASVVARLIVGYLLDRFFAPLIGAVVFALCGVGVYILISQSATAALFLGAMLVGLGLGSEGDIAAYMSSRYFPRHSYARVLGAVYFCFAMGSAAGIFLLGQVYRVTGSYAQGAILIVAMIAVAVVCVLTLGPYLYALEEGAAAPEESDVAEAESA